MTVKSNLVNKKNLLILTLGATKYNPTAYTIKGMSYKKNGYPAQAEFVAEPIINSFEPDMIFVLGTITSSWHGFYKTLIRQTDHTSCEDNDGYRRLKEINEHNDGMKTSSADLERFGKEITALFEKNACWESYSPCYKKKKPEMHILLTKYGIDDEELKENFRILKGIEQYLETGINYQVAFDVTHSFRSLPLYNLIIFNYIRSITRYSLTIRHVYYGMFEVLHEKNVKEAPIVDLADVINVLDLTNGVSEFKNTGNAVLLLTMLKHDDPVREALDQFDLATQLNAFDKIKQGLVSLYERVQTTISSDDRFTSIREMIDIVLSERFLGKDITHPDQLKTISDIDLKFQLTTWFFNQNRMGLGLATGLEALRDINTVAFIEARGFQLKDERTYRESAEAYFIRIARQLDLKIDKNKMSKLQRAVHALGMNLQHYKDIRNIFAHSLDSSSVRNLEDLRSDIKQFQEDLERLRHTYKENREAYTRLFQKNNQLFQRTSLPASAAAMSCRVVITFQQTCPYNKFQKSNTARYDVFFLNEAVKNIIIYCPDKKYPAAERAFLLYTYLKNTLPAGYEHISIIIDSCPSEQVRTIFQIFIERLCEENERISSMYYIDRFSESDSSMKAPAKTGVSVAIDDYQEKYNDILSKYPDILEMPLKKYWSGPERE